MNLVGLKLAMAVATVMVFWGPAMSWVQQFGVGRGKRGAVGLFVVAPTLAWMGWTLASIWVTVVVPALVG